jgi:hypothetical protein
MLPCVYTIIPARIGDFLPNRSDKDPYTNWDRAKIKRNAVTVNCVAEGSQFRDFVMTGKESKYTDTEIDPNAVIQVIRKTTK